MKIREAILTTTIPRSSNQYRAVLPMHNRALPSAKPCGTHRMIPSDSVAQANNARVEVSAYL